MLRFLACKVSQKVQPCATPPPPGCRAPWSHEARTAAWAELRGRSLNAEEAAHFQPSAPCWEVNDSVARPTKRRTRCLW
eukprot:7522028-Pyramimonas_sp.AAC.1